MFFIQVSLIIAFCISGMLWMLFPYRIRHYFIIMFTCFLLFPLTFSKIRNVSLTIIGLSLFLYFCYLLFFILYYQLHLKASVGKIIKFDGEEFLFTGRKNNKLLFQLDENRNISLTWLQYIKKDKIFYHYPICTFFVKVPCSKMNDQETFLHSCLVANPWVIQGPTPGIHAISLKDNNKIYKIRLRTSSIFDKDKLTDHLIKQIEKKEMKAEVFHE